MPEPTLRPEQIAIAEGFARLAAQPTVPLEDAKQIWESVQKVLGPRKAVLEAIFDLHAITDCINRQKCTDIIWMLPPWQAEAVHECVQERLLQVIKRLEGVALVQNIPQPPPTFTDKQEKEWQLKDIQPVPNSLCMFTATRVEDGQVITLHRVDIANFPES